MPTIVAVAASSNRASTAVAMPSSRQTSSVTVWNTSLGRRVAGDQRRHAPQRRLLLGEPAQLRLRAPLLGEVAHDRHDLAVAARHHPRLVPARRRRRSRARTRRLHARRRRARARCTRATRSASSGGRTSRTLRPISSSGGEQQLRAGPRPARRGRCRRAPTRSIRSGIASSSARLRASIRCSVSQRPLVREREAGRGADGVEQLGAQPQRAVVDERADRLALVQDRRRDLRRRPDRACRAAPPRRRRSRRPRRSAASSSDGSPSARRSASCEVGRCAGLAQLDEQLADGRA